MYDFTLFAFGTCEGECQLQASLVPCSGLNINSTGHGVVLL